MSFATVPMIPLSDIGDMLFDKKGAIVDIATNPELKSVVKEKAAETSHSLFHIPSISEWLGIKDKIHEIANEMHTRALATPDPNDDKIDFVAELYKSTTGITHFMPEWFKEIVIYITAIASELTHNAVQTLLKWIYNIISSVVLWTPEFLFNNDWFSVTTGEFSILSMAIVIIFTMIEGLKKIVKMNHTPFRDIIKKLPIALSISAACPFLFTHGIHYLNKLTHIIMNISKDEIGANKLVGVLSTAGFVFEPINLLMMAGFAILFLVLCIPMTFFHAKRWFDLLMAGVLTPFAMSCYLFEDTHHLFRQWFSVIKGAAIKQLAYAVFVSVLGLLMFATPNPETLTGVFSKLLLMLGGLHSLAFQPNFIKNLGSGADNKTIISVYKDLKGKQESLNGTRKNVQEKSDKTLIKAATIAGKIYRKFK